MIYLNAVKFRLGLQLKTVILNDGDFFPPGDVFVCHTHGMKVGWNGQY